MADNHYPQVTGGKMTFIVAPLELLEQQGVHVFSQALEDAERYAAEQQLDRALSGAEPAHPAILAFITAHAEELRRFARRRRGAIYIASRLDEPPPAGSADGAIAGYPATFVLPRRLRRFPVLERAAERYSQTHVVIVCHVAHSTDPERLDQLSLALCAY
jgi:hypothetical protein